MSYSANVKSELFNVPNENNNENLAELLGIFMAKNSIKENEIILSTENIAWMHHHQSLVINLPPLAGIVLQIK